MRDQLEYRRDQESLKLMSRQLDSRLPAQSQAFQQSQLQVPRNNVLQGPSVMQQASVDYQSQQQQQQQIYYTKQSQQLDHSTHLQAQLLPNGQTVYVNTAANPASHSSLQLQQQQQTVIYQGQQAILQPLVAF